jgi:hypothetical protein
MGFISAKLGGYCSGNGWLRKMLYLGCCVAGIASRNDFSASLQGIQILGEKERSDFFLKKQ